MVMVRLEDLYKVTAKSGKVYYYAWKGKGAPRLKAPPGSPAFIEELAAAQSARFAVDKTTVAGLCSLFRDSDDWKAFAPKTKAEWGRWLDRIEKWFGETKLSSLLKEHPDPQKSGRFAIVQWRRPYLKTPRAADMGMQTFSRLCAFGVDEGLLARNPCAGIKRVYENNRAEEIWREADFAQLKAHASQEVFWAAQLAVQTGLRRGDLLRLSWSHVRPHHIEISTGKSSGKRTVLIPIGDDLRALLKEIPRRATTILTNTDGDPWKSGFPASWGAAAKRAGISGLRFHDLRGTAATRFFMAGFSIREIAETMGWSEDQVDKLINVYVKRDEIILRRVAKLNENAAGTASEKI